MRDNSALYRYVPLLCQYYLNHLLNVLIVTRSTDTNVLIVTRSTDTNVLIVTRSTDTIYSNVSSLVIIIRVKVFIFHLPYLVIELLYGNKQLVFRYS